VTEEALKVGSDMAHKFIGINLPNIGKEGIRGSDFSRMVQALARFRGQRISGGGFRGNHVGGVCFGKEAVVGTGPDGLAHTLSTGIPGIGRKGDIAPQIEELMENFT